MRPVHVVLLRLWPDAWHLTVVSLAVSMPFFHIFNDFFQTNYLNIHWTDLHQIRRVGRTMTFYPQNWVHVPFCTWRRTTRSASAALAAGKPVN